MTERIQAPTVTRDWVTLSDEARAAMAKFLRPTEQPRQWGSIGHGQVVAADQST